MSHPKANNSVLYHGLVRNGWFILLPIARSYNYRSLAKQLKKPLLLFPLFLSRWTLFVWDLKGEKRRNSLDFSMFRVGQSIVGFSSMLFNVIANVNRLESHWVSKRKKARVWHSWANWCFVHRLAAATATEIRTSREVVFNSLYLMWVIIFVGPRINFIP